MTRPRHFANPGVERDGYHGDAGAIYEYAAAVGASIRAGGTWGQALTVPVVVSCMEEDREFTDSRRWRGNYSRWFAAWRAGLWRETTAMSMPRRLRAIVTRSLLTDMTGPNLKHLAVAR